MKPTSLALAISALPMAAFAEPTLNVLNWSEYLDRSILPEYTEETGTEIRYDVYEDGETTEVMLMAGSSGYDLVVISSEYIQRLASADVVGNFDLAALTGLENLDEDIMQQVALHDPSGTRTVPYLWGTTGIGYDAAKVFARMPDAPVDSWRIIFEPDLVAQFADCGVGIVDAPEELLAIALNYLGHDPNSTDAAEIDAAAALLRGISPYVKTFGIEQLEDLASGDLCLAVGWSGDVLFAADNASDGVDPRYSVPSEGAPIWFDLFVIPADAENIAAAHDFVSFNLRPEIIARNTNFAWYANPNSAADEFVDQDVLDNPAAYPPAEARARLFSVRSRGAAEKHDWLSTWRMLQLGL